MATHTVCLDTANMSRSVCWITKSKCEYLPTGRLISVYEPDSLQMRASFCPRKLFAFLFFTLWLSSGLRLFSLAVSLHFVHTFFSQHPSLFIYSVSFHLYFFICSLFLSFLKRSPICLHSCAHNYDSLSISWWRTAAWKSHWWMSHSFLHICLIPWHSLVHSFPLGLFSSSE